MEQLQAILTYGEALNNAKKQGRGLYSLFYFCAKCGWILKGRERRGKNGQPLCPKCGKGVRTKPRRRRG
jgi:rubrerythrin